MEECACISGLGSSPGRRCRQQRQGPTETAAAEGKPARQQQKSTSRQRQRQRRRRQRGAVRGVEESGAPCRPTHCSLQDLPVEMLVDIFAWLPGTDLLSLALACTRFHRILHIDSIWRRHCREEFGFCENLQNLETIGMSYREVYAKLLHPYRHILGLWQLGHDYRRLLKVVVDGLGITGWMYGPSLNTHVDGPMPFKPAFRIRLTERESAAVECLEGRHSRPHHSHLQIEKDRLTLQCKKTDHRKDSPTRLRGRRGLVLSQTQGFDFLVYHRLYLPPCHPDDLIRPGLFQGKYDRFSLSIVMLSLHGKYARVTKITGDSKQILEIHLKHRIQLRDGEIFRNFNELSRVVQEIDEQVIREQQQKIGTEESEGHGWQSPAQPSVGEFGAAASEEQPVPFVLPVGVSSSDQNYPRTCRMCLYASVDTVTVTHYGFPYCMHYPGVFVLFDEDHFGFTCLELKYFILYGRVQDTFQNVEAPSPQAFRRCSTRAFSPDPLGGAACMHFEDFTF